MCGIAGILSDCASRYKNAVHRMIESLSHRGPDGQGIFESKKGNCVLGHSRLSIIDLSQAASQPMKTSDQNKVLVYNGECYNYETIKKYLIEKDVRFQSTGDTEVILNAMNLWGTDILPYLNGMFALAMWDENEEQLILARDRFGQKPIYYATVDGLFLFASEVRALLASGLVERKVNIKGMLSFLYLGSVHGPDTIVNDVNLLSPGQYITVNKKLEKNLFTYWEFPSERSNTSNNNIKDYFLNAVSRHLVSDVPLGLFLSGGIDSSAVCAAAKRASKKQITTINVSFPEQLDYNEEYYAKKMALRLGTNHHNIPLDGKKMFTLFRHALKAMDQPTIDGINTYIVSYAAKKIGLKVVLSGLGGDELFGGYPSFRNIPLVQRFGKIINPSILTHKYYANRYKGYRKDISKITEFIKDPNDIVHIYLTQRMLFSPGQLSRILNNINENNIKKFIEKKKENLRSKIKNSNNKYDMIAQLEIQSYMGEMLLRDSDVMGMAHGIEIRLPFLDAEFTEMVLMANGDWLRKPSFYPKSSFVNALDGWIPNENANRKKRGFTLPFREWILNEFKSEIETGIKYLADNVTFFHLDSVESLWKEFCKNPERIGWTRPWSLFVLSHYLEQNGLYF